jgi:hypothetical protein
MAAVERHAVLEEGPDAAEVRPRQRTRSSPEEPVVNDHEICAPPNCLQDRRLGSVHGYSELTNLVWPSDLKPVQGPWIVRMSRNGKVCLQIMEERF